MDQRTVAEVDLGALRHNVSVLRARVEPAALWCVVKANGYGHGAVRVARACRDAGASGLCVALTAEAVELRGDDADVPILVLSEQPPLDASTLIAIGATPTVYTRAFVDALGTAARAADRVVDVHVKVDTGMHRVGLVPDDLGAFVSYVNATGSLRVDAVFTHLANADEPADDYNVYQLDRFDAVTRELGIPTHAANSAALLAHPRAVAHALVRAGIAIYGIAPGPAVADDARDLRPVLSWRARVSFVKRVPAGARLSYGLRGHVEVDTTVATVPVGYADGVPRRGGACGVDVLVGGRRRRILGTVTMDQFLIDCGDDDVAVGDEVVLIGGQGAEHVSATEWGERTGTIAYEIVCGLSARVPRQYAG